MEFAGWSGGGSVSKASSSQQHGLLRAWFGDDFLIYTVTDVLAWLTGVTGFTSMGTTRQPPDHTERRATTANRGAPRQGGVGLPAAATGGFILPQLRTQI